MNTQIFAGGKFLNPELILSQCEISPGSWAADFGCGSGYFSLPLAGVIGKEGRLFSFDVIPQALEAVSGKAKSLGLDNVVTSRVNLEKIEGSKLQAESLDFVVLKDVLFQNKQKELLVAEAYRVLKKGGKALVVEWNQHFAGIGPEKELRIPEAELKELAQRQQFELGKEIEAGKFHYAFLLKKI